MNFHRRSRIMSRMMPGMILMLTPVLTMVNGLVPCAMAAPVAAEPTEVIYHTKLHDTLIDLARRYFNRVEDYRVVQQLNHVPIPEHLQPDIDLHIPVAILRGDPATATVLTFRGDVRLGEDRHPITPGAMLTEGLRIETGAASFLTFRAADGSSVTMPSQSVMRLERMRRILFTGTLDQRFSVERGRLETTVAKQIGPGSHYEVRTPIAVSAVRGTVFRVAYGALGQDNSLTEVLGGTVAVSGPGGKAPVPVPVGIGAAVAPGGGVKTETLLPAPTFADSNRLQAGRDLRFALAPVPGAAGYHLDIARDAAFQDVVAETRSTTPEASLAALPDGTWFVRAAAIAPSGLEGLPATQPFDRHLQLFKAAIARDRRNYRVTWTYAGQPGAHFRVQLQPTGPHPSRLALDEDRLFSNALVLDGVPPGLYRWRVGAINGQDETWTAWREVKIEGAGK
jgi:hypothetical protein